jgi:hypothetical protein
MREIDLDASKWATVLDFYDALLSALGAPDWHGRSINALIDSMIWGGINRVEPPYLIRIRGIARPPKTVQDHIELARDSLLRARAEFHGLRGRDVGVSLEIVR